MCLFSRPRVSNVNCPASQILIRVSIQDEGRESNSVHRQSLWVKRLSMAYRSAVPGGPKDLPSAPPSITTRERPRGNVDSNGDVENE